MSKQVQLWLIRQHQSSYSDSTANNPQDGNRQSNSLLLNYATQNAQRKKLV